MTEEEIAKRNFRINVVIIALVYIIGLTVNIVFLWWARPGIDWRIIDNWTTRQAKVVNLAPKVNAKASTTMGTEKVSAGKKFRFGGSKVDTGEVAFA